MGRCLNRIETKGDRIYNRELYMRLIKIYIEWNRKDGISGVLIIIKKIHKLIKTTNVIKGYKYPLQSTRGIIHYQQRCNKLIAVRFHSSSKHIILILNINFVYVFMSTINFILFIIFYYFI